VIAISYCISATTAYPDFLHGAWLTCSKLDFRHVSSYVMIHDLTICADSRSPIVRYVMMVQRHRHGQFYLLAWLLTRLVILVISGIG
jgi:hypothetical protein